MFIDDLFNDNKKELTNENLRKWFKEKWVRFGPDGKIRGDCARSDDSEGKPKCLPQAKAHALGKKGRKTAASRKRREDPNPERSGPAINVKTKESLAVIEGTESQYIAARYIDEFADGDHWYVKGTPDIIKKFVLLANSLEDEAVKGSEYEPDKGMMAKVHAQLGDDSGPQWTVVKAQNLEQLKPIGNRVLQLLMKPDLSYGAQEFMSEFLWTLEEKGLALVTGEPQQGVAESFTDDLDNIYAMHPQPEKSEQVVFLITGMTEDEFSNRWTDLPDPYQQEFGHDLPLWDSDDLSSYPNLAVKRITFDQYVQLVGNYIKSEELAGSTMSRMKKGMAEGLTKQARARKEAESVKAAIERLEQQLKDPNPHIDKDSIRRRLETEKRRLELYRDVLNEQGVAEGSLNEGQYEMMMRNGQVKKFIAKDDADAKRIAAGHGAKSVIRLRGGVPAGKVAEQGVAEGSLNEFVPDDSDDLEDPFDNYPCYDCGSTIFLHHTKLCDLAEPNAVRDLPAKPGSQHWTGEIPKGLRPILGLGKGMSEGEFDKWGGEIKTPSANWKKNLKQPTSPAKLAKQQAANRQRKQQSKLSDELRQLKNQGVAEDKRIARKPGQPVGSKSHSDLYTDENPKGTIQGLKFATAADATASVSKIRNSGRSHAHKIQAAVAMEQRARAAGKIEAAGVYRKFINSEKRTINEETKNNRISPTVIKRIQHLLNTKFEANLDVDGILGPLTIATIKKFIPKVNKQLAPEPNKTTAIQGKQTKSEDNLTELAEACWKGYHKEGMKTMFGKRYPNCVKNTNEELVVQEDTDIPFNICPGCGGDIVHESLLQEKQDACYHKVKSRYKVWPSAYASGALVQCRKRGAKNWGTKSESIEEAAISTERYTLYINGNPAAYYTDEVDAMTALKELKTAYPKTKIQIMRQECKDEPWSKIMESAQVEAWGLRYNPKTERKEYWKKVFDNQQLARAFVDKFNFELLGLIPVQDKTTNSNYIKENNNRFYFDVGKSTSATDLRNKFHLRHDSNGWYLREGQENFKQYLRNAMKTFAVIK